MQLDRNRIVIRERGWLDLLDLALCVIRVYAWPLLAALLVGIVPWMLFNAWLLGGLVDSSFDGSISGWYWFLMLLLILWEIPLATAPATIFLGEAVFMERPGPRHIAKALLDALPQLIVYQVIQRAMLIPLVITWIFPFGLRPYLNEVILLERNPMKSRREGQITTAERGKSLHADSGGDLFVRWIISALVGFLLFLSFWASMVILNGLLFAEWDNPQLAFTLYYPSAIWITIGYFTVVRFLGYLDLRIRREGWEVELMMRAEGAKLARQLT